jgi:hypothetical protein
MEMPMNNEKNGTCLDLNCTKHEVGEASITHGLKGDLFMCHVGSLSDADLAELRRASETKIPVRLLFSQSVVSLTQIACVVCDDGWVRVEGRVIDTCRLTQHR